MGLSEIKDIYDRIWEGLTDFVESARKDLHTDLLNMTLNKRLSNQFYPISFTPKKLKGA